MTFALSAGTDLSAAFDTVDTEHSSTETGRLGRAFLGWYTNDSGHT